MGWSKGGTRIFSVFQRGGGPKFFEDQRGGTKIFFSKFVCAFAAIPSKYMAQPFPLAWFMPYKCLYIISYFSQPFFFQKAKGGRPEFLPVDKGGDQNFSRMQRGDQKKLATGNHKQTASLPVKNDSSLMSVTLMDCR